MKMKKFLALSTASVMALSMAACGSTDNGGAAESSVASTTPATAEASSEAAAPAEVTSLNYAELTLGEDYTDITTTIKVLTNRTDLLEDGAAVPFQTYIDAFNYSTTYTIAGVLGRSLKILGVPSIIFWSLSTVTPATMDIKAFPSRAFCTVTELLVHFVVLRQKE